MISLSSISNVLPEVKNDTLREIDHLDKQLQHHFQTKFLVQPELTRLLVSFQANKARPIYRWYKYKEAFSAALVELLLQKYGFNQGKILDPFAGSGTALFAASNLGIDADGIELLPIGQQIIETKKILDTEFISDDFARLKIWSETRIWKQAAKELSLPEFRITQGAYSIATKKAIEQYLGACRQENSKVQKLLHFALLCVVESISYTRKDGQYLRWDYRSGRGQGKKPFNKGVILDFDHAITDKIGEIVNDLEPSTYQVELFLAKKMQGEIKLYKGSCLRLLPTLSKSG